jgi:hypothetical protein
MNNFINRILTGFIGLVFGTFFSGLLWWGFGYLYNEFFAYPPPLQGDKLGIAVAIIFGICFGAVIGATVGSAQLKIFFSTVLGGFISSLPIAYMVIDGLFKDISFAKNKEKASSVLAVAIFPIIIGCLTGFIVSLPYNIVRRYFPDVSK